MAAGDPTPEQLAQAPLLFKAWPHLRLALAQGLRDSPKLAHKIASGIRLGK